MPVFMCISVIFWEPAGLYRLSVERLIALSVIGLEELHGMEMYTTYLY